MRFEFIIMQAHIFIYGFVQGVGFRRFVKRKADGLSLYGWVRNTPDQRVEAVFQSDSKEKIEKIISICKKGHFLSEVSRVEVIWEEEKEKYSDFKITFYKLSSRT